MKKIFILLICIVYIFVLTGCVTHGERPYNGNGIKKGFYRHNQYRNIAVYSDKKEHPLDNVKFELHYGISEEKLNGINSIYNKETYLGFTYEFVGYQIVIMDREIFRFLRKEAIEDYLSLSDVQYVEFISKEELLTNNYVYKVYKNRTVKFNQSMDVLISEDVFKKEQGILDIIMYDVMYCPDVNRYLMYEHVSVEVDYSITENQTITFTQ